MNTILVIIENHKARRVTYNTREEAMKAAAEINDQTGARVFVENKLGDVIAEFR